MESATYGFIRGIRMITKQMTITDNNTYCFKNPLNYCKKYLVFASYRSSEVSGQTNIIVTTLPRCRSSYTPTSGTFEID